ncbi:DUF3784 domain-containing protein [uncultured Maribacter sp.]|uniref:DUF3784 domain-containing protein n=1 Tax=uncultured Maribacter sp. TaxID=431308 RepID=UPI00262A6D99|nr:DUF3784 domain-containing protein [uncultured Maribacter sp.]
MTYILVGMSLLFVAIGFIVTENNAKYLLSGYNTMTEEERKKVDIKSYIPYFRKFHIILGISFLVLGYGINLINKNYAGIFLAVYPILTYIYFAINSSKFSGGLNTKSNKIGLYVIVGAFIFVVGLISYGFKENKIVFDSQKIELKGIYGETIETEQIKSIEIENELPKITLKTNGFALGEIRKGFFKTANGEIVKLILNSEQKSYILLTKSDGKKIYYSARGKSNEKVLNEIKKTLPNNGYSK